jgi:protein SCO1/2
VNSLHVWVVAVAAAVALDAEAAPPTGSHPPACHQPKASDVVRTAATYSAPAVKLLDQQGNEVDLHELLSTARPVALNFIFTSCRTVCPVLSASLASLHRMAGSDVRFISISIDPEFDTPPVLKEYARRFDVGPAWSLLTGRVEAVAAVRKAFDAASRGKDDHKPLTFLRPAGSEEWVRLDGFPSTSELVASLRLEAVQAAR